VAQTSRAPVFVAATWTALLSWVPAYADPPRCCERRAPGSDPADVSGSLANGARPEEPSAQSEETQARPQAAQQEMGAELRDMAAPTLAERPSTS